MATAEELLAQMEENPELYADSIGPVNDVIVINAEERTIELPESEKIFGVESDKASERKYFKCPKIVGDNIDLSTLNLFINFKNANNEGDIYHIDDVVVDGDYITFSWLLSKKVTAYKTDASKNQLLSFIFCAKSGESPDIEWNTTLCSDGIVLEGLEPGESIVEDNPDIIQYILERLNSAGVITPEQISEAVEEYFASNPIQTGATEEQAKQIEKNMQDISKLSEEIANQSGITTNHANTLWAILQKTKFYEQVTTEELNAFKNAWGIESSGGSEEGGGDTPTVTYTVTRNLVGCTSNSNVTEIREGSTLNETLTTNEGYTLPTAVQGGSISITMGGTDITSNVYNYNTGVINISSVTGNVVINVECVNEAVLPTNGLDDYFDLRNAELVDLGSYKSYKATVGNGAIFGNANENITTDDKGMLYARYIYSTEGNVSWNDYPMPFTFASLTHSIAYKGSSPYMPINMSKAANNQWNLCPIYNNSSGSTTQLDNIPQGSLTDGYHTFFITAKDKVLKFYLNGNLIQTCNGDDYDDFVSWKSFQSLGCLQYLVDHATAFATWNRVLTENELNEVERYFRTLEVE